MSRTPDAHEDGEDSPPEEAVTAAAASPKELLPPGQMLAKEQQTGYLIAGAVGVLVLILGISRQIHNSHSNSLLAAALGVAGAGALAFAVHQGKRMFAAIISIVGGLALSGFFPLNFAFLLFGAYVMFKQSQAQKKLNKAGVGRTRQPRARGDAASKRGTRGRQAPADNRPKANRRYTPPKSSRTGKRTR